MARNSKKQPFAYAKKGSDGKWYHWTALAGKLAAGVALGGGAVLGKWLFGDVLFDMVRFGLSSDVVNEIKRWFGAEETKR
jgi:hypothetical protein